MSTARTLLVVGSYNRDVVVRLPRLPVAGETLPGAGIRQLHGGKGSNQAVQAARCGAAVRLLAAVGDDAAGAEALRLWAGEGIDVGAVRRLPGVATGSAVVLVEPGGGNRIAIDAGANARLAGAAVPPGTGAVLGCLEVPVQALESTFRSAREAGARVVLNAAPMDVAATLRLMPLLDVLVLNRVEAAALAGGVCEAGALCRALQQRCNMALVVVTDGGDGVWFAATGAQPQHRQAPAVPVLDTTGAGDAFCGALAVRLLEGAAPAEAVRFAAAAGALACTVAGAEPALHRRARIEELA